ncbi:MAG: hypothetical protein ACOYN3_06000 [Acidimicrobiia bacterium]
MEVASVGTEPTRAPNDGFRARRTALRWAARAGWALLALLVIPMVQRVMSGDPEAVRVSALAIAWCYWLAGLSGAVFARDAGATTTRVTAPIIVWASILIAARGIALHDGVLIAFGIATTIGALALTSAPVLQSLVDAASYGSEARYPLRTPLVVGFLGLPLAWITVAVGTIIGPLLLADGSIVEGVASCLVGLPLAALSLRSVHTLSTRWLVLVPAGVVVRDQMILTDPILIPRDHIARVTAATGEPIADAIDLRLGAFIGTVRVTCTEPTEGMRVKASRRDTVPVDSDAFLVAPMLRSAFLAEYRARGAR